PFLLLADMTPLPAVDDVIAGRRGDPEDTRQKPLTFSLNRAASNRPNVVVRMLGRVVSRSFNGGSVCFLVCTVLRHSCPPKVLSSIVVRVPVVVCYLVKWRRRGTVERFANHPVNALAHSVNRDFGIPAFGAVHARLPEHVPVFTHPNPRIPGNFCECSPLVFVSHCVEESSPPLPSRLSAYACAPSGSERNSK